MHRIYFMVHRTC